ncbi:YrhK-like protein [Georgenia satyanarayanai]|uniref:YrhK-like protein n=1 Tax=Georgenia satyanarayanai TaxID=860221 RepID=A0A2Y9APX0_9MICO|nr:YrhK family protein [Georgenia satyanarayanai]PYF96844.1 YrhK-like protein [Georgenia satyanarayanai]SSA46440.1 YrhK-like protein [Georgenia satyanarayanai]
MTDTSDDPPLRLPIGPHEYLTINNRYETMSIANDVLIAVFFVAGSIMFFFESLQTMARVMFLLGSIDFLLRPAIRLARRTHLERIGSRHHAAQGDEY